MADDPATAPSLPLPARFAEPDRPDASLTLVRTPAGGELDVADPALAAGLGRERDTRLGVWA